MSTTLIQIPNGVFCATLINNREGILCNGKPYHKIVDFCNEYRISSHKLIKRLKRGIDPSEAIRMGVQDSEGVSVEYIDDITPEQFMEYCKTRKFYGASTVRIKNLVQNKGKSLEEAIDIMTTVKDPPPVDGVKYDDCEKLAQALGLDGHRYLEKKIVYLGFSEAIIWAKNNAKKLTNRAQGFYYREVYYKSLKEASIKLGFGYVLACQYRMQHPDSTILEVIDYALMKKRCQQQKANALTSDASKKGMYVDHLGELFSSLDEMCEHWNIDKMTYRRRILESNWSIEKALTTPIQESFTFHNVTFKDISRACNIPLHQLYHYKNNMAEFLFEHALWENKEYIGLTDNGELVVMRDGEVILMTFSEYIQILLKHEQQCA